MNFVRLPLLPANIGQACYQCFKEQHEVTLQRCSRCSRVSYCSTGCQKANWPKHKALCNALKAMEVDDGPELLWTFGFQEDEDLPDTQILNNRIDRLTQLEMDMFDVYMGRIPRVDERNLVGWEPRCLACGRSDLILRITAASNKPPQPALTLKPCPDCRLSFYCSKAHWAAVKDNHHAVHEGFSQCKMNKLCLEDAKFAQFMGGANQGEFKWAPERTKSAWTSLKNIDWTDFQDELNLAFKELPEPLLEPLFRAATEALSMPMTILWALENLNPDDSWTRKSTLNIHMLGAAMKEIDHAQIFEEILHRLPEVKTLKLTLVSPEMGTIINMPGRRSSVLNMDTCPDCTRKRRKRIHDHRPMTYHEFTDMNGYVKPDLAIAFDSGCSQDDVPLWEETMERLVDFGIPTVFTAFGFDEAELEAKIMIKAGATLHPELGPKRNPWASKVSRTEPNKVNGVYTVNGWLSGGFHRVSK